MLDDLVTYLTKAADKPLKDNLAALKKNLEALEERYVIGDLEKDY